MKRVGDRNVIKMEEHCPQPGLPAREDFVVVAEALSQVKSLYSGLKLLLCDIRFIPQSPHDSELSIMITLGVY